MTKHTPGPWIAGKTPRNPFPDPPGDKWSIQAAGSWWVADVYPFTRGCQDGSEAEANARLIAAAPDLLEAGRWLMEAMANDGGDCWCALRNQPGAKQWITQLKAAVAGVEAELGEAEATETKGE